MPVRLPLTQVKQNARVVLTQGQHRMPPHRLFDQRTDVRQVGPVRDRGHAIHADDAVDLGLREALFVWVQSHRQNKGQDRCIRLERLC